MNSTYDGMNSELRLPYLINVAKLYLVKVKTLKKGVLQPDIIKKIASNVGLSQLHQSGPGSSCALNLGYLFGMLYSNACTRQRFITPMTCENV